MSLTIIDHISPPAPRWVYQPPPSFKTETERLKYYLDQEYPRWVEGYQGLTGQHYFYMQQCWLKDVDGNIFHPEWRDVDEFIFQKIDYCINNGRGLLVYKRREVGATSIFAGGLPFWFARIYPGCLINMTSKDRDGYVRMFDDKVMTCYNNIDEYVMNRTPLNKNNTKNQSFLKLAMKKRYDDGTSKVHETTLNLVETSETEDSVTKFSGGRGKYSYVDEAPLHKRIKKLIRSMEATLMKGTEKKGFLAMAGTVEDKLSNKEIADFKDLIHDVKAFDIDDLFVPAWMGLITQNGHSDEKAGTEWVLKKLEEKEKSSDPHDARAWRMNYPLSTSDIFQFSQGGMFEEDVAAMLQHTMDRLMNDGCPEAPYQIFAYGDSYEAKPSVDGDFYLIEAPKKGIIYYCTIDSIGAGTDDGAEQGSKYAAIIFKGFDPAGGSFEPVCTYYKRPKSVEQAYTATSIMMNWYNKFGGFKEVNYESNMATGDHFGTFLKRTGLYKFAAPRRDVSGKGIINTDKKGQPVNEPVKEWQIKQANVFLRKYGPNIRSKLLLLDLMKKESENADLRSAFFMFMISMWDFDKPVRQVKRQEYKTITRLVNENGYNVYRQFKMPVGSDEANDYSRDQFNSFVDGLSQSLGVDWYNAMNADQRKRYEELVGNLKRG